MVRMSDLSEVREMYLAEVRRADKAESMLHLAVSALDGKGAKPAESAVVDIRRLSDELEALKTADAKRIVALTRACSLVRLFSGVPYDISWLGDNYSEEIVDDARKRLEGLSD